MNPYEVLGLNETAGMDEIKKAYRDLVRKYHPDNFTDKAQASFAEEKMKSINQAYDEIIFRKKSGKSFDGKSEFYNEKSTFADVRSMIKNGRIAEAEMILNGTPESNKNAEWYFLKGNVFTRRGWMDQAYSCFEKAKNMNPSEGEYNSAFNYIRDRQKGQYGGYNVSRGKSRSGCGCCETCCALYCIDSCCEICGKDFITCC